MILNRPTRRLRNPASSSHSKARAVAANSPLSFEGRAVYRVMPEPYTSPSMSTDAKTPRATSGRGRLMATPFAAQVCGSTGHSIGMAVGSIMAAGITGTNTWSGVPIAVGALGTALASWPLARLMERSGRRLRPAAGRDGALRSLADLVMGLMGAFGSAAGSMILACGASPSSTRWAPCSCSGRWPRPCSAGPRSPRSRLRRPRLDHADEVSRRPARLSPGGAQP